MSEENAEDLLDLAAEVVDMALKAGVDVAEAKASQGWELTTKVRLGETELVQEAGHRGLSLRVFRDNRVALTSTSALSKEGKKRCVQDAVELLELSEADPLAGPAPKELLSHPPYPDLELYDPHVEAVDAARAIAMAQEAEEHALQQDKQLSLSEGATASRSTGSSALVLSSGFSATQNGSYLSLSASPLAVDQDGKRYQGSYWDGRRHLADLSAPSEIGAEAGRRALRRVGATKVATCQAPVVFDSDMARSLIGTLVGCLTGGALWRKSSYLLDKLGQQIAASSVTLVDDPLILRAPGSRPFDGEGLLSRTNRVVEEGVLRSYLLDTYSAKKLNLKSTHSARRSGASVGASCSNFIMQPGELNAEELIGQTERGLYVTEMMGFGFNAVTGDFSRGAAGFWIEQGKLAFPVSELTISGNLHQMLLDIDLVASELDRRSSVVAPSFRIREMTVAGQ